jgi:uncharacterized coiled-coil protein SlyX
MFQFSLGAYIKAGVILAVLAGLAYLGLQYRAELIERGREEIRTQQLKQENKDLSEALVELTRLSKAVYEHQQSYEAAQAQLGLLRGRLAGRDKRLQEQDAAHKAQLAAASADSLRRYGEVVKDNFDRSREHVKRFGLEAIERAAAAEALKANLDSINKVKP